MIAMIRKPLFIVCCLLLATTALAAAGFIRPTVVEWRTASGTAWASVEPGTFSVAFDPDSPYTTGGGIVLVTPGRAGWWPRVWFVDAGVDAQGGGFLFVAVLDPHGRAAARDVAAVTVHKASGAS